MVRVIDVGGLDNTEFRREGRKSETSPRESISGYLVPKDRDRGN